MKIRSGFVTNSSSSSFILQFKEIPKTIEDIRSIFFSDSKLEDKIGYFEWEEDRFEVKSLCRTILHDLKNPLTFDEVYEQEDLAHEIQDFHDWVFEKTGLDMSVLWREQRATGDESYINDLENKFDEEMKEKVVSRFKVHGLDVNKKFFVLEYEDKGDEAILEYGHILEQKGLRVSRH